MAPPKFRGYGLTGKVSSHSWVAGLHIMGIICRCPLHGDVVYRNARLLSYIDAYASQGFGQTRRKIKNLKETFYHKVLHPSRLA